VQAKVCFGCGAIIGSASGGMTASTTADKTPNRFTTFNDLALCPRCDGLNNDAYADAKR
jgi:hypothetical protein